MSARLLTHLIEKPWGRDQLPAPFNAPTGCRVGEIWFEPPDEFAQLLVKYIFTSEPLSVQVHPSDSQLPGKGKEECWLVVDAEPGARLGLGLVRDMEPEAIRQAALDGTIEELLEWQTAKAGDFFHVPAGTIHAIGAGLSLIEIQQNSDVTYRLHDYGRPRELQLDQAIQVARVERQMCGLRRTLPDQGHLALLEGPHFRVDRFDGAPESAALMRYAGEKVLMIPIDGSILIQGEEIEPGQCGVANSLEAAEFSCSVLVAQPCGASS